MWGGNQTDARIRAENQLKAAKAASKANPKDIAALKTAYDAAKYAENKAKGKA